MVPTRIFLIKSGIFSELLSMIWRYLLGGQWRTWLRMLFGLVAALLITLNDSIARCVLLLVLFLLLIVQVHSVIYFCGSV